MELNPNEGFSSRRLKWVKFNISFNLTGDPVQLHVPNYYKHVPVHVCTCI